MSAEPKRVELTEAEIDALLSVYQSPSVRKWPRLLAVVADIVTAREADAETREAAARREALLEAEAEANALRSQIDSAECASRCYRRELRGAEAKVARAEALAEEWDPNPGRPKLIVSWAVEAVRKCGRDLRAALAEPERDEEGGR